MKGGKGGEALLEPAPGTKRRKHILDIELRPLDTASSSAKPNCGLFLRGCSFGNEEQFPIKPSLTQPLSNPSSTLRTHIPVPASSLSPSSDPAATAFTQVQRGSQQGWSGAPEDGGGQIREVRGKAQSVPHSSALPPHTSTAGLTTARRLKGFSRR